MLEGCRVPVSLSHYLRICTGAFRMTLSSPQEARSGRGFLNVLTEESLSEAFESGQGPGYADRKAIRKNGYLQRNKEGPWGTTFPVPRSRKEQPNPSAGGKRRQQDFWQLRCRFKPTVDSSRWLLKTDILPSCLKSCRFTPEH